MTLRVTLCRPGHLGPGELARWRELARGQSAHPFLSPEFALAAGEVLASARVGVIEEGGDLVGFWPLSLARSGTAGPIVPGQTDREGVVHAPGLVVEPGRLLAAAGLSAWSFDHLLAEQAPAHSRMELAPAVDLASGLDAYLDWLKAEHRSSTTKYMRNRRRLEAAHTLRVEVGNDRATLERLMGLKSAQCRAQGWTDLFAPAWARRLLCRLAEDTSSRLQGVVVALRAGEDICAGLFSLRLGRWESTWLAVYDPAFATYSPGVHAYLEDIRAAARAGVTVVELGKGREPHKAYLGNLGLPIAAGLLAAPGARGTLARLTAAPTSTLRQWLADRPEVEQKVRRAVQGGRRAMYRSRG